MNAGAIDRCLPQTQCTRCGYPDCLAYAEAVASGETGIDRCPPGGRYTLAALAGQRQLPVPEKLADDVEAFDGLRLAVIREAECIGCTRCIDACPVDAIVGSGKRMHGVVAGLCTGCELCLPPCPVDCIDLVPAAPPRHPSAAWPAFAADAAERFRKARARRRRRQQPAHRQARPSDTPSADDAAMARDIHDAVARSRARRQALAQPGEKPWTRKKSR